MKKIVVAFASDHAGFDLKKNLILYLESKEVLIKDFGTFSEENSDYPDFIHPLAESIEKKQYDFGIILCGSGNGVSMVANKYQGIRAALCWKKEIAKLARQHNDANVCAIASRFTEEKEAKAILDIFLNTDFEGGRHQRRVNKIPV